MKILILGINYLPEPVGIGPYTAGMARALVEAGHEVTVVCGKPYYPNWQTDPAYGGGGVRRSMEDGVEIYRCPIYVPRQPSGARRVIHHISFLIRALPVIVAKAFRMRPDVVMAIAPSLIASPAARIAARLTGATTWLHIQDFEVEAAFATGLLSKGGPSGKLALAYERWTLQADRVSTISPEMCAKLLQKGLPAERIVEFRNWANIEHIAPLQGTSVYRQEWNVDRRHVALYSGNIANKQGIEIIVETARLLAGRKDLLFVVCGNGANREQLIAAAGDLDNIRFYDLQPVERLSELLGLATVHLLPQIAGAANLVLPSKMANMLASGRPIVATAEVGTGLALEVEGCGLVVPPGNAQAMAAAIEALLDDEPQRVSMGQEARQRATERWHKGVILQDFEARISACRDATAKPLDAALSR